MPSTNIKLSDFCPTDSVARSAERYGNTGSPRTAWLAKLTDIANNTIIKIEAGKNQNPTLDTLKKIAKALGVPMAELFK